VNCAAGQDLATDGCGNRSRNLERTQRFTIGVGSFYAKQR
jgi:hypothetical protein